MLVRYVYSLRGSIEEMTTVEEVLIDRVNYLTLALEDSCKEINLLHQRLNILVMPPMEPILPQDYWNIAHEVINPTGWDEIPLEPPINSHFEVPINPAPFPQEEVDNEPLSSYQGILRRCSTNFEGAFPENSSKPSFSKKLVSVFANLS
ncbi:hypothetical protein Hanom_Chr06g00549531 [Helianthus anomalus]